MVGWVFVGEGRFLGGVMWWMTSGGQANTAPARMTVLGRGGDW